MKKIAVRGADIAGSEDSSSPGDPERGLRPAVPGGRGLEGQVLRLRQVHGQLQRRLGRTGHHKRPTGGGRVVRDQVRQRRLESRLHVGLSIQRLDTPQDGTPRLVGSSVCVVIFFIQLVLT